MSRRQAINLVNGDSYFWLAAPKKLLKMVIMEVEKNAFYC
jgi:hypothetical protein